MELFVAADNPSDLFNYTGLAVDASEFGKSGAFSGTGCTEGRRRG